MTDTTAASSRDLCAACSSVPYDLVCSCGSKFDFFCVATHAEEIRLEFNFVRGETEYSLSQLEQLIASNDCMNAKTILENWKQKRFQDINDITDEILNRIERRENIQSKVPVFRTQYNSLANSMERIVHKQLDSIFALKQEITKNFHELENLPELVQDSIIFDKILQSKLNLNIFDQNSRKMTSESIVHPSHVNNTLRKQTSILPFEAIGINMTSESDLISPESVNHDESIDPNRIINIDSSTLFSMERSPQVPANSTDDFEPGLTANINLHNATVIPTNNDKFAGTVCCHDNQLIYNNYNSLTGASHLVLIPNIDNPTVVQTIQWNEPETIIGGGDNNWIQDITYSKRLSGYLILNHSRLRFLSESTHELEEFCQFPDRSMKRVSCNDTFICLLSAAGITNQNGDEIIFVNYDKEETASKTFRDILVNGRNDGAGIHIGEITDIGVSSNEQIMLAYRLNHRSQVRVGLYNITNDGNRWTIVKQLLLHECWRADTLHTPRLEWLESFGTFVLVEYVTCHLILLDETGRSKGETYFSNIANAEESPLNIAISNNDWLCARYETSINIRRFSLDRLQN